MYLELDYDKIVNLDDLFRLAKQKAERAGRISGLNLWPRIEGMFRFQPLFWTSLHPMEQVLQPICRFVLESLDLGLLYNEIATAIAGVGSLDFAHMPVHPSIVRHFGIEWAGSEYKYRFLQEGAYTAREYAERFIRFDHDDDLARGIYNLHCINDVAGGLAVLQEALKRHPGSGDLMMNIAVAHFRLGDVPNAFRMAIDALATDPKRPEWSTFVCHIARLIRADLWAAPAAAPKPKPAVVQQPSPAAPPPPPSPATAPLTLAQLLDKLVQWPLPPPRLRFLVAGTEDERPFIELGQNGFTALIASLREVGIDPASLSRVLEFGCGVGRVLRYWSLFPSVEVHGTDIAPEAIAWARQNLTFGHFATNALQGPLNYPEEQFDLVYALSVFTHLPVEMQGAWFRELLRIVRPGGLIYITMHGAFYRFLLSPEQAQIFDAGELVVTGGDRPGSNICAAFHPWAYVEREFIQPYGMEVLQFLPKGARGNPEQDSLLLRKPA
jgi:SAM-dependent methyltransferase